MSVLRDRKWIKHDPLSITLASIVREIPELKEFQVELEDRAGAKTLSGRITDKSRRTVDYELDLEMDGSDVNAKITLLNGKNGDGQPYRFNVSNQARVARKLAIFFYKTYDELSWRKR